jgi:hypothetical protein
MCARKNTVRNTYPGYMFRSFFVLPPHQDHHASRAETPTPKEPEPPFQYRSDCPKAFEDGQVSAKPPSFSASSTTVP